MVFALIVLLRYFFKTKKGKAIFKDWFNYAALAVVILGIVGHYIYSGYKNAKPDITFGNNEIGVYILPFRHDTEKTLQKALEAALTGELEGKFENVKFFSSTLKQVPPDTSVKAIAEKRNAGIVLSGKYIKTLKKEEYYLKVINIRLGGSVSRLNKRDMEDTAPVVDAVKKEIEKILDAAHGSETEEKYSEVLTRISHKQFFL